MSLQNHQTAANCFNNVVELICMQLVVHSYPIYVCYQSTLHAQLTVSMQRNCTHTCVQKHF